jgi:hypothetical protein
MGKRSAKFRASEKRFLPLSKNGPTNHVCSVCMFVSLDGPGLQMHFIESPYCACTAAPPEFDEESHLCKDEIDDDVGSYYSDNHHEDDIRSPSAKVTRLSSPGGVSDPGAKKDDAGKYEFVAEHKFPANVDDEVHVELVQMCRRIGAPLYAYNNILKWAQEAHVKGYTFPLTAPKYNSFMTDLAKRLELDHLSHTVATIVQAGGGTMSFPTFNFEAMFLSLLDDTRIQPHLLINWDDPSKPLLFNKKELDEIHSGCWHSLTSSKLLTAINDILCGVIFFIDRTKIADKERQSLPFAPSSFPFPLSRAG